MFLELTDDQPWRLIATHTHIQTAKDTGIGVENSDGQTLVFRNGSNGTRQLIFNRGAHIEEGDHHFIGTTFDNGPHENGIDKRTTAAFGLDLLRCNIQQAGFFFCFTERLDIDEPHLEPFPAQLIVFPQQTNQSFTDRDVFARDFRADEGFDGDRIFFVNLGKQVSGCL